MKIFIVEDDQIIANEISQALIKWNYETFIVTEFEDIMPAFNEEAPHLVLMDVNLPFYNGYYWCQQIRQVSELPIIFISSVSDRMDMIMAMRRWVQMITLLNRWISSY